MNQTLSSKIEELQRRWRDSDEASEHPHVGGAFRRCADELTPLLELAKEMERAAKELGAVVNFLDAEAEKRMAQALVRFEMAKIDENLSVEDSAIAHKLAEQMAGRKLRVSTPEEERESAEIQKRIAEKLEKESREISKLSSVVSALAKGEASE